MVQPHLLKNFPNPKIDRIELSEDTVEKITQGMYGVVNEGGTAAGARLKDIEFCGKSGSAQVIGYDTRSRLGKQRQFKDNAWFVGYAPRRNPEIVVAVLVQGGEHGGAISGPIAGDVVKTYYDKKKRRAQEQTTASNTNPNAEPAPAERPVVATIASQGPRPAAAAGAPPR
jgi:penicillin-binding protein 2